MMQTINKGESVSDLPDPLAEASEWFVRLRSEEADVENLARFQRWLEADPGNPVAYRKICASWSAIGEHASAPEIMIGRRDALEGARRAARGRWQHRSRVRHAWVAGIAFFLVCIVAGVWWQTRADVYSTGIGERRTVTLSDGSVVTLDARSRVRVKYRDSTRSITLQEGQARFDVAKDPRRPFRVEAGQETIVALGTKFNVELVSRNVLVTLIEGQVAVTVTKANLSAPGHSAGDVQVSGQPGGESAVIELAAGESLHVRHDGEVTHLRKVNLARITGWQDGKMFFDNEPLSTAVERVNRYAREQIQVDPSAADVRVSGVFNTGDASAFVEAVTAYFPVEARRGEDSAVQLTRVSQTQ